MKEFHGRQTVERRARLAALRARIAQLRGDRRAALAMIRTGCKTARRALPERLRAYREAERARLGRELKEARQAALNRCQAAKAQIRLEAGSAIQAASRELAEEKRTARLIREAEGKIRKAHARRAVEVRQESDDEVRGNIPTELVPIFERVKRQIQAGPRRTRTEAFFEWVEEHTEEVAELQAELAEAEFGRLLAEHEIEEQEEQRAIDRARRGRLTRAELAAPPF
jgi:hypothetical protein